MPGNAHLKTIRYLNLGYVLSLQDTHFLKAQFSEPTSIYYCSVNTLLLESN